MRKSCIAGVFLLSCVIAGCQTTGTGVSSGDEPGQATVNVPNGGRVSLESYNLFYDQGDHLNELISQRKFGEAAKLYIEQKAYFTDKEKQAQYAPALQKTADELNGLLGPNLTEAKKNLDAVSWPAPPGEWPNIRSALARGVAALEGYDEHKMLKETAYRMPAVDELAARIAALKGDIERSEVDQFKAFNHFGEESFFARYPVDIAAKDFVQSHPTEFKSLLTGANMAQMAMYVKVNTPDSLGSDAWAAVSDVFIDKRRKELERKGDDRLTAALASMTLAKKYGLKPSKGNSLKVAFVEVTSRTLLKEGAIDFPAAVDTDLPVEAVKANLDDAMSGRSASDADYLIVFDVALATVRRRVTGIQHVPSRVQVGVRTEPNPERANLQNQLTQAQLELNNANMNAAVANSEYCYGLGCLGKAIGQMAHAAVQSKAKDKVASVMQNLAQTPMTIDIPLYQDYKYDVAKIRGKKTMTVHYYVIDKRKKQYFKSTFDVVEDEVFEVAYKVEDKDPEREKVISAHRTEQDVVEWEKQASTVKLSSLVDHYLAHKSAAKPLPSATALRQDMLKDKNVALTHYKEQTFEGSTQNDPRFDSVVVVFNPQGWMGSGFFVRPDVVMTNYHVVGEQNFVEMRMYDKQETFGKVIARDAGLDLALVKVQSRGKPVPFYNKNKLDLGSTVEVIGHPRGLEFSITRGVVSAVRRGGTPVMTGGKGVLQIQIDAATSPGNSGGPVFLKDHVVGVVSWGRVDQGSENLNFIIHYSEAKAFIDRELKPDS